MYAKVFSRLWDGSLCGQANAQLVFIYLLAYADNDGMVCQHRSAVVTKTGLTTESVNQALDILESIDPSSGSDAEGGRRIVRVLEGRDEWRIVNFAKYRAIKNEDDRRRQNREAQSRRRQRLSASRQQPSAESAQTETETETETEKTKTLVQPTESPVGVDDFALTAPEPKINGAVSKHDKTLEYFDQHFWPAYPRKQGKDKALKALRSLVKTTPKTQIDSISDAIWAGLQRYKHKAQTLEPQYVLMPATWINGRRWEDSE